MQVAPDMRTRRSVPEAHGPLSFSHRPATEIEGNDVKKRQLFTQILPKLAGLLPPGADIMLDLRWGEASLTQTDSC